jgi:quinolinate synthase
MPSSTLAAIREAASLEEMEARMTEALRRALPEWEIREKARVAYEVNQLKRERNAVILGHNYMEPALFASVPDYVGDSLELSRISANTEADVIVFCGVKFMAETAKVLSPEKTVLIPSTEAGCSLAAGITAADVRDLRRRFPGAVVVSYVNTYADVKAESDYCCTSGNAAAVVKHLLDRGETRIIFLPDEFLAANTAREAGLPFVRGWEDHGPAEADRHEKCIIGWNARCEVHDLFTVDDVRSVKQQFPEAITIAHPECSPEVMAEVDVAGSTKKMVEYVRDSDAGQFMLFTECSMGDNIAAEFPDKEMVRLCSHRCPHMATITLEQTREALAQLQYQVELPENIIEQARKPIDRMLSIG